MEFSFPGTSAGTPTRSRNVTGLYQGNLYLARDFASYTLGKDLMLRVRKSL